MRGVVPTDPQEHPDDVTVRATWADIGPIGGNPVPHASIHLKACANRRQRVILADDAAITAIARRNVTMFTHSADQWDNATRLLTVFPTCC